jgi:phospholipase/carboxylesterase
MTNAENQTMTAIADTVLPLLQAMDSMLWARQRLDPFAIGQLAEALRTARAPLRASLSAFQDAEWPDGLKGFRDSVNRAAEAVLEVFPVLDQAAEAEGFDALRLARRAFRFHLEAERALYPLAALSPPVSQYYLPPEMREDAELLGRLDAAADAALPNRGVSQMPGPDDERRGGYGLYVPEYLEATTPAPVVLALHGGGGNGFDFLWSWLPAARAYGAVLVAPSALGDTWAIMGDDIDSPNIDRILDEVAKTQALDRSRILLTGMSDGGTFSYVAGLMDGAIATHLAPFAASFHPMLLEFTSAERLAELPIRLTHGARDWMFQVDMAQMAVEAFQARNANIVYSELPDRAHVFPQDEAAPTLNWFLNDGVSDAS